MTIEKISKLKEKLDNANRKIREFATKEGKRAIGAAFKPVFDSDPKIAQIAWAQFTPHFCDGDPCVFGVDEPGVYLLDDDLSESFYEKEIPYKRFSEEEVVKNSWAKKNNERYDTLGGNKFRESFYAIWNAIPSELMEAVFGDGYLVKVTRDSIEIQEYDHD